MLMMVIVFDGGRQAGRQIDSKIRDTCSYHYMLILIERTGWLKSSFSANGHSP